MTPLERLHWLAQVSSDHELPRQALRVAVSLAQYVNSKGGGAFPGLDNLAADSGIHRATVARSLASMEGRGHLSKAVGGGRGRATEWRPETVAQPGDSIPPETVADNGDSNAAETVAETVANGPLNCRKTAPKLSPLWRHQPREPIEPREPLERARGKKTATPRKKTASQKGRRWGAEETIPADWLEWAAAEGAGADLVSYEAERFPDYWRGRAGAAGVKLDWPATWRNWIRKAMQDEKQRRSNGNGYRKPSSHEELAALNRMQREADEGYAREVAGLGDDPAVETHDRDLWRR